MNQARYIASCRWNTQARAEANGGGRPRFFPYSHLAYCRLALMDEKRISTAQAMSLPLHGRLELSIVVSTEMAEMLAVLHRQGCLVK